MARTFEAWWLGRRRYEPVHALQHRLVELRQRDEIGDTVLLLEHEPVITLGRGAKAENILLPAERLAELGVDLVSTGRGGDVTAHAPGQLVVYPIVRLPEDRQDVRRWVGDLRETMLTLTRAHGVEGGEVPGLVGLWVDALDPAHWPGPEQAGALAKVGAIGVRLSRWVSMHGFALNLSTDLDVFSLIVPCGISAHGVTSLRRLTGVAPSVERAAHDAFPVLCARVGASTGAWHDRSGVPDAELIA